ncbi:MAG: alpha/beta fold hydrolase [Bacteroidota bacterium]
MNLLHSIIKGEGHPLLILHGFLGMSDNWKTLGNQFSENGFQVHLIDQRNHGRSFHADAFNYTLMAEDVFRYITHHQLKKVHIIGHSMGGKTAMFFATAYPQHTAKLLIVDIGPKYYPSHHQDILRGLHAVASVVLSSRSQAEQLLSAYVSESTTRQFLLKNLYWNTEKKLVFRFNLASLTENVESIGEALFQTMQYHDKTLFLRGTRSNYISKEDEPGIKTHFPNAVLDDIEHAGHWLHADQPQAFFAKALAFLQSDQ